MTDRPINLRPHEVRAFLDGRKTQLRRVVKPQPSPCGLRMLRAGDIAATGLDSSLWYGADPFTEAVRCPFGAPGDTLWGRETWAPNDVLPISDRPPGGFIYRAELNHLGQSKFSGSWRSSTTMPRWAARIHLTLESVRVERLHDITEEDAMAEGMEWFEGRPINHHGRPINHHGWRSGPGGLLWATAHGAFREQWEAVHGARSWDASPCVWVATVGRNVGAKQQ